MKTIRVNTKRPYDIIIEEGSINKIGEMVAEKYPTPRKVCLMTDSSVGTIYADKVLESLNAAGFDTFRIIFPTGEHSKNLITYTNMLEALAEEGLVRSDIIVALGGGIVGDLAGFVAATYMRGIDYVYVPTSLLAILDSSIGGKTGVNLLFGKNMVGVFWSPGMVITDPTVLDTLPEENKREGLAEALKSAVVSDGTLVAHIESKNYEYIIERCISINKTLIEVDEYDTGLRQLLSFGHTLSHGIEKLSSYSVSHGDAVAKGMVGEAKACAALGYSRNDISKELKKLLKDIGFNTDIFYDPQELYDVAIRDKKIRDGAVNIIVPEVIGKCSLRKISLEELKLFIEKACQ